MAIDEAVAQQNLELLNAKLEVYEKILSKQKYIGGDVCLLHHSFPA